MTDPIPDTQTTKLTFDVDAALLVELGERLVARRSVALAELIKNAYDADATKVTISLTNTGTDYGEILVEDDGLGMTLDVMKSAWMRIATTDATKHSHSKKYGRPRTGAKGVGRFACGKLASHLTLESVTQTEKGSEKIYAEFHWPDFKPGLDLAEVPTVVKHEVFAEAMPSGTTLRLSGLTQYWAERDITELQSELADLMNPIEGTKAILRSREYSPDPGFQSIIIAPEFPKYEGDISERFLSAAWGILHGTIGEQGTPQYFLNTHSTTTQQEFKPLEPRYQELQGIEFTVRMMVYKGDSFRAFGYNLSQARDIGRLRGGVKVYLDGFQVYSYGSPGDDWLELDQDRARRIVSHSPALTKEAEGLERPMLLLPGNMQLFGAVSISRDRNPGLSASISRERLVQNRGFEELRRFVREGINWMTVCYARQTTTRTATSTPPLFEKSGNTNDILKAIKVQIEYTKKIPSDVRKELKESVEELEEAIAKERSAQISEQSMLRVLASAGTTILVFDHTLRAMASQLSDIVNTLAQESDFLATERIQSFEEQLEHLKSWASVAVGQGSLVGLLVGSEARTKTRTLAVRPLIEALHRGFSGYMDRFGISLDIDVAPTVRTPPLLEAELYAVLLNLLTNAFKAVREGSRRQVNIESEGNKESFLLRVNDTGVGLPKKRRQEVFGPFVTTSQPDPVLGVGTGLGLTIARDIVESWNGQIYFKDADKPWKTSVEIAIPYG